MSNEYSRSDRINLGPNCLLDTGGGGYFARSVAERLACWMCVCDNLQCVARVVLLDVQYVVSLDVHLQNVVFLDV